MYFNTLVFFPAPFEVRLTWFVGLEKYNSELKMKFSLESVYFPIDTATGINFTAVPLCSIAEVVQQLLSYVGFLVIVVSTASYPVVLPYAQLLPCSSGSGLEGGGRKLYLKWNYFFCFYLFALGLWRCIIFQ